MSRPAIQTIYLNENVAISERHPDSECRTNNWWLHDKRAGYNIGMREETRDGALVKAIEYWAKRAISAENKYSQIMTRVNTFIGHFVEPEDVED